MKSGKYLTGSDALAFVKEEIFHIFKSSLWYCLRKIQLRSIMAGLNLSSGIYLSLI